jgi:hypothetical protein
MREPPLGLDVCPDAALDVFFDEIAAAPDTDALLAGLYLHALPALAAALRRHLDQTNRLMDHPSVRICRFALIEVDEMVAFGARACDRILTTDRLAAMAEWRGLLDRWVARAGDLDGTSAPAAADPPRQFSSVPRVLVKEPRRDSRFTDPYNMGVHAEAFLYDAAMPPDAKTLMMFYKRLREIDVPEMMASIIAETPGKPWQYYVDMTRQLWDEARHAMIGEVGFVQAGLDWTQFVRVNFTWSLALNTQLTPIERHAVLYFIEQGLMPRTGKRFEWEVGVASGDPFSAIAQDYDWADEVLHARIGRDWYVKEMGDSKTAAEYGDRCWSRVLIDWHSYLDRGLTRHENWWPALYREWCRVRGAEPDSHVLAFHTSYAEARADLKDLSASG